MEHMTVDPSGCWVCDYKSTKHGGHKKMQISGKCVAAHRASYAEFVGPIPEGMQVLHSCDNPPCINPDHLFLGTPADNVKDMFRKGRAWQQRRAMIEGCAYF
jgi:hypothetical protein